MSCLFKRAPDTLGVRSGPMRFVCGLNKVGASADEACTRMVQPSLGAGVQIARGLRNAEQVLQDLAEQRQAKSRQRIVAALRGHLRKEHGMADSMLPGMLRLQRVPLGGAGAAENRKRARLQSRESVRAASQGGRDD